MAKSIYEILNDLTTSTSVPGHGDEIEHTIPARLFPDDKTFEDADALLAWANEEGYTHALLQKGLQKGLIDARATFKACKKTDKWSPEYGQKNVDAMEWSVTKRPISGMSDENKALSILGKMSPEEIAELMKKLGK